MKTLKFPRLFAAAALLFAALTLSAAAATVDSADALLRLMNDPAAWSGDYTLTTDIDLAGSAQSPIGNYATPFTGSFDGAGHTVSGLNIAAGEAAGFFAMRLISLGMETVLMLLLVDVLHFNDLAMKLLVNILVIIANYIFSKLFIFKKK